MSQKRVFNTNAEHIYVNDVPEYNLDLVNARSIDPAYSFTRNSAATYIGPDGLIKTAGINQPRFDYDPVTGDYKGLLVEESRTRINNSYVQTLGSYGLSSGNGEVIAPDGTSTGITKMTGLKATTGGIVQRSIDVTYFGGQGLSNFVYCVASAYVYATSEVASGRTIDIGGYSGYGQAYGAGVIDLQGNLLAYTTSNTLPYALPRNKWVRIFIQFRKTGQFLQSRVIYNITNNQSNTNFLNTTIGDPVIYFWGLYKEIDSTNNNPRMFPSSFIPTNGTTRQPDQLVLNKTLNTQGTFFIESRRTTGVSISADNGTESLTLAPPVNQNTKSVLYYNTNRTLLMSSGNNTPVETNTNPPQDLNRVSIGFNRRTNGSYMNGHIKKFSYYSSPLTEDNLRALTDNKETISRNN